MQESKPHTWNLWAKQRPDGSLTHFGPKYIIEHITIPWPVVPVTVTESEHGEYWGFIYWGTIEPSHIHKDYDTLNACFFHEVEEAQRGGGGKLSRGRIVRLTIIPRSIPKMVSRVPNQPISLAGWVSKKKKRARKGSR